MNRMLTTLAGLTLVAGAALPAAAQNVADARAVRFGLQAGIAIPLGDFGDVSGNALLGAGILEIRQPTWPVGLRVDAGYARFGGAEITFSDGEESAVVDVTPTIIYGTGSLVWTVPTQGGLRPYLLGGPGFYRLSAKIEAPGFSQTESENKFGVHGGAGLAFGLGAVDAHVEARFHSVFTEDSKTNFAPIVFGLRF